MRLAEASYLLFQSAQASQHQVHNLSLRFQVTHRHLVLELVQALLDMPQVKRCLMLELVHTVADVLQVKRHLMLELVQALPNVPLLPHNVPVVEARDSLKGCSR